MRDTLRVPARVLTAAALLVVMASLLDYARTPPIVDPNAVTRLALAAAGLTALLLGLTRGAALLGFVGVYGLYLALSHLGVVGTQLFIPDVLEGHTYRNWFHSESRPLAVTLSGLAIGAFGLGASAVTLVLGRARTPPPRLDERGDAGSYAVGMTLLAVATFYMLAATGTGALPLFGGYAGYRDAMQELRGYSTMLFCLATGLAFTLAAGDRRQRLRAGALFLLPALLLLLTGNRGEVLYPLAAGIAVSSVRGARLRPRSIALLAAVFFLVIPVVRQIRGAGLSQAEFRALKISPVAPFVELGFTLRPVVVTAEWIEHGEEFAAGRSYLLPVQRLAGLVVPFVERPDFRGNRYYIKERTLARGRGMGYSVVAEAYFNFGTAGVVVILGGIGVLLAALADRAQSSRSLAFMGALMATLVNNIRNAFGFVPGQLVLTALICLAAVLVDRALRARSTGRHRAAPPVSKPTWGPTGDAAFGRS